MLRRTYSLGVMKYFAAALSIALGNIPGQRTIIRSSKRMVFSFRAAPMVFSFKIFTLLNLGGEGERQHNMRTNSGKKIPPADFSGRVFLLPATNLLSVSNWKLPGWLEIISRLPLYLLSGRCRDISGLAENKSYVCPPVLGRRHHAMSILILSQPKRICAGWGYNNSSERYSCHSASTSCLLTAPKKIPPRRDAKGGQTDQVGLQSPIPLSLINRATP
jgi:hypothetical protein